MQDVIIIGAGPIGLACGIAAQKQNLSYTILEKGVLVNSLYHYPTNMTFFSTSEKLEIGGVPFISHNPKPTKNEALEYYRRVAMKFQLNMNLYESVQRVDKTPQGFRLHTSKSEYKTSHVVFANGFYDKPYLMQVPGEDLPKVRHYYTDPHPYFNQKVVVVGSQNSAVDAALECWRKGADVTMIIRNHEISDRVKYWVRPDIENRIKEGSISAYFNAEITEINETRVSFLHEGQVKTIANDFVLAMTGYQPQFDMLTSVGITLDRDNNMRPKYNPETMETDVPGIYLAGVVCGGLETHKWFIENSRVHADLIMEDIASKQGVLS